MIQSKNIALKIFIFTVTLFLCSCESEPVTVDSSILDNNSFFVEQFSIIDSNQPSTSQDLEASIGNSQRLYSGMINGVNSTAFLKMNFDIFKDSEYCNISSEAILEDSMISVIDSVRLVFRTFTKFLDENDELLIEKDFLDVRAGFISQESLDNIDSLQIFNLSSTVFPFFSLLNNEEFSSVVNFEEYSLYIHLPFEDWCNSIDEDYIIIIEYTPTENDDIQYIELVSSQYTPETFRPSLDISYKKIIETSSWVDFFTINSDEGVTSEETQDIYYVYNDTLDTKSTILLVRDMEEDFNESSFNLEEIYLEDIELYESSIFESGSYNLDIKINLNEDIPDSVIQFVIDNVVVLGDTLDPANDNFNETTPEGTENNDIFDSIDSPFSAELYKDLGTDRCPDQYENGSGCYCNYVNDIESCLSIEDSVLIYNPIGTEGNGVVDIGEIFPDSLDVGSDGCTDEYEEGLDDDDNPICSETPLDNYDPDANGDNYLLDPALDNWGDCGADGFCNEDEDGYDSETNPDPAGDDWGSDNLEGTEGNLSYDEGEGTENNNEYDDGESFKDWGIDGVPEIDESNCEFCVDDGDTEENGVWNEGEPFDDTGTDGLHSFDEEAYNPLGTEGNNQRDSGETFTSDNDCGTDGLCNEDEDGYDLETNPDPNKDDYNVDPNNDNWGDCGVDSDCEIEDEAQGNGVWDSGEKDQNNGEYDSGEGECECDGDLDTCTGECFYDWGIDQIPDNLEVMDSDFLLTYSVPGIVEYNFDNISEFDHEIDESKDILIDFISITAGDDNSVIIKVKITANQDFRAIQFRLNHLQYYQTIEELVESSDFIHQIDNAMLFEDVSIYHNVFLEYEFSDSILVADYSNAISFTLNFGGLSDFIDNNPDIYINNNHTKLLLNINHSDSLFNFFEGSAQLIANIGEEMIQLGMITASANSEVSAGGSTGIPFGPIISDMIDGTLDPASDIIFTLDGNYNNQHRLVFHKTDSYSPILEVFYSR